MVTSAVVGFLTITFLAEVPDGALARRVRVVPAGAGRRDGRLARRAVSHHAVAAAQLHRRVLRHRAAVHLGRGDPVAVPAGRRLRRPLYIKLLGDRPGTARASGIATTALAILLVGAIATNVVGKRLLQRAEWLLLHVPLFRSVYAPVKQLVVAFSPDNEYGFKRVVLIEDAARGLRARVPDQGVHDRPRARARRRWWRSTCRLTTSIWATSSICPRDRASYPGHHGGAGHPHFPDRRHGPGGAHSRPPRRRSGRGFPGIISGVLTTTSQRTSNDRKVPNSHVPRGPVVALPLALSARRVRPGARAGAGRAGAGRSTPAVRRTSCCPTSAPRRSRASTAARC